MKKLPEYYDVFVPGGYPAFTYNPRSTLALEGSVESVTKNLCKLVVVTGHTKSGKTVLVQKILPRQEAVWIDGGGVGDENDLWSVILDSLGLFQGTEVRESRGSSSELSTELKGEGGVIVAKVSGGVSGKASSDSSSGTNQSRMVSTRSAALSGLRRLGIPLVIDDFHYLPKELQGNIIRALKPLVFEGVPVVIIAIPHRRYDAVKVEKEMTGRILSVSVPAWSKNDLGYIPETGFPLLRLGLSKQTIKRLANESIGSPHLMQEFCREICKSHLKDFDPQNEIMLDADTLDKTFRETAETTIGRPIFEKLARGPRMRSDRIQRRLKTGDQVDIYGLVLSGLAHLRPGLVTLEYEDLRTAIKDICVPENVPNLQEVARVLKHMAEISATDESSTPVIDFDEDDKRLHVTDPFFAFYLRWGHINK